MYEIHLWMLFALAVLTGIGTFGGVATQYTAVLNFFAWMLLGMAIPSTTLTLGDGSTTVVGQNAVSFAYLAYLIAVTGWVPWFVTLYEWYVGEERAQYRTNSDLEAMLHGK